MEIRRALPKDAGQIFEAEREIFPDPWSEADVIATISTEGSMCYVALADEKITAYVIGRQIPPEGEIYRIATLPEYRRRNIAYRLLDYTVKCERGRGLENLFLEVREQNTAARLLYESYGFKKIGERKNYYKNPTDNAIIMLLSSDI